MRGMMAQCIPPEGRRPITTLVFVAHAKAKRPETKEARTPLFFHPHMHAEPRPKIWYLASV